MARKFLYLIAIIIVLIVVVFAVMRLFPDALSRAAFVPSAEFVEQEEASPSVYENPDMWFSQPGKTEGNAALWVPEGFTVTDAPKAAVFFVHPTSYLKKALWNGPLDDKESQDRAKIFIRSQASVFNGVADIWAPRYRQATLGAFLTDKPEAKLALNAAYRDVLAAFDEFVKEVPAETPIILAGHSQGSVHLTYLLQARIANQPISKRIVAVYIGGWPVSKDNDIAAMGLPFCETADQTGCVFSWQSYAEPAEPTQLLSVYDATVGFDGKGRKDTQMVCTNPITGTERGEAMAEDNLGTLVPNDDLTDGEIVPQAVPARCDDRGLLLIGDPPELGKYVLPGNNYHVYDYPLFWANLRADVERRVAAFIVPK